ncbi:hypothetical protein HPB47_003043 [Ixodes persulcatus]|uniref:Uncharacterized protein n=1 Tax=Ixodes persulcatus TaxID=34615 RepID=A0AC60PJU0_IXOPE|nr:hypothetical protein HPB47_003043 [Ixodes persulcatus]
MDPHFNLPDPLRSGNLEPEQNPLPLNPLKEPSTTTRGDTRVARSWTERDIRGARSRRALVEVGVQRRNRVSLDRQQSQEAQKPVVSQSVVAELAFTALKYRSMQFVIRVLKDRRTRGAPNLGKAISDVAQGLRVVRPSAHGPEKPLGAGLGEEPMPWKEKPHSSDYSDIGVGKETCPGSQQQQQQQQP